MKNSRLYIILLIILCSFSACLDEDPIYTQNNEIVFSTEGNVEQALLGCYGYMTVPNAYGQMWQEVTIGASGLSWSQHTGSDTDMLVSLNMLASNSEVKLAWNGMYKVIAEINAFLEALDGSSMTEEVKIQKGGEAKFLRAIAYYNLIALFGDVPLKVTASSSEGISAPRTAKEEVFKLVIEDLEAATKISETSSVGRLNSWAAKAFLGKVYHKMATLDINKTENLNNAKARLEEVYNKGIYSLEKKYSDLFGDYVSKSKEAIIQFNFTTSSTVAYNRASNRFAPPTSTTGISWGTFSATKAAYDLNQGTYPGDPRIAVNFLTQYRNRTGNNQANPKPQVGDVLSANDSTYTYPYLTYTVPLEDAVDSDYVYKNGIKTDQLKRYVAKLPYDKFSDGKNPSVSVIENYDGNADVNYNEAIKKSLENNFAKSGSQTQRPWFGKVYDQNQVGTASNKNLMVYRYAEMLLIMADVYNELGTTDKAIDLVNEVLQRARQSSTPASAEPQNWDKQLSKEEVKEKLYFECIIELMGEPSMFDVTRQGGTEMLKKLLALHNNHEVTQASSVEFSVTSNGWLDNLFNNKTLDENFLKKNLLLPIPDDEISSNPGIDYSDNNFGY